MGNNKVSWSGGEEHWTNKGDVRLFFWRKPPRSEVPPRGTILFVHGSSMASQPTFDLSVPGRPDSSAMDWFAARGFDTWCMDCEGYGRSDKHRPVRTRISPTARTTSKPAPLHSGDHGRKKLLIYGISSGALRAGLFAQRHPERVARLALDAFVWTGEGSPTLAERKKKLSQFRRCTGGRSTGLSCTASSSATIRTRPTWPPSMPSPTRSSRWMTHCRPAPTSTCARGCRWSTRRRSRWPPCHARPVRRHRQLR